jgi:16S rRNA A1518/A1519 N6-dimethyltransferase RsmA/KsgA/DIM1 with predicted DNA glycosylase/AP lyase activity
LDIRVARRSLGGTIESPYEARGVNKTQSTDYRVLKPIFKELCLKDTDSFLDVGCGKGRIIGYLLHRHFRGEIIGVELNSKIALFTSKRFKKHNNVHIITGDILENIPPQATILYLFNPFTEQVLEKLVTKIEKFIRHPALLIYCNDVHRKILENRANWSEEKVFRVKRKFTRESQVTFFRYIPKASYNPTSSREPSSPATAGND